MRSFRELVVDGDWWDLASALAAGIAFVGLVSALARDLVQLAVVPALFGAASLVGRSRADPGQVLANDLLPAALEFLIVVATVAAIAGRRRGSPSDSTVQECPECLSEIPSAARRCAYCTAVLVGRSRRRRRPFDGASPSRPENETGRVAQEP